MSQQNNKFTAFWMDTTTAPWTPLTGLSATINIRDVSGNLVVDNQPMTELWGGHYVYTFVDYNKWVDYVYDCNPWATAFRESGVTNNIEQLISEIRTTGGWFSINYGAINAHTSNKVNEIKEQLTKIPTPDINEIKSHIDLAKNEVITTIESIEIPEVKVEEKEAKKAIKLLTTLDKKVSGYIDSEMSDKEELGAIAKQFSKLEMEDAMKEKEKEMEHKRIIQEKERMEAEQDEKLLEEIKSEFDRADEKEKEEKRKELEKELEETLKEAEEIKKELKTI